MIAPVLTSLKSPSVAAPVLTCPGRPSVTISVPTLPEGLHLESFSEFAMHSIINLLHIISFSGQIVHSQAAGMIYF